MRASAQKVSGGLQAWITSMPWRRATRNDSQNVARKLYTNSPTNPVKPLAEGAGRYL